MGVNHHESRSGSAHLKRYEPRLVEGVGVFACECVVVCQDGRSLRERHIVFSQVCFSFLRVPLNIHGIKCMDKCRLRQFILLCRLSRTS